MLAGRRNTVGIAGGVGASGGEEDGLWLTPFFIFGGVKIRECKQIPL